MGAVQGPTDEPHTDSRVGAPQTASKPTQAKQTKKRKGRSVPVIELPLGSVKSKDPTEDRPSWAKPLDRENVRDYANRLNLKIGLHALRTSLKGETAAHAKFLEQALKTLGIGQRSEIDVTARQDDWTRNLTDEELRSLVSLHKAAQSRQGIPPNGSIPDNSQAIGKLAETGQYMLGSDNNQYVKLETNECMVSADQPVDQGGEVEAPLTSTGSGLCAGPHVQPVSGPPCPACGYTMSGVVDDAMQVMVSACEYCGYPDGQVPSSAPPAGGTAAPAPSIESPLEMKQERS